MTSIVMAAVVVASVAHADGMAYDEAQRLAQIWATAASETIFREFKQAFEAMMAKLGGGSGVD